MANNRILILDFGGQYNQLIARRVRECGVYCEVRSYDGMTVGEIKDFDPMGLIFTGGPMSAYGEDAPSIPDGVFNLGIPVLGICYGAQLIAHMLGGRIDTAPTSEYGRTEVIIDDRSGLLSGVGVTKGNGGETFADLDKEDRTVCWMSHTDYIAEPPEGFVITAHTADCPVAGMEDVSRGIYAVQFHPEVEHTVEGFKMLKRFVLEICGCRADWKMDSYAEKAIADIRGKVGGGKVLLALSGGVDSSVAAVLLSKAVGRNLTCVFVDHGLMRKDEGDQIEAIFGPEGDYELNFIRINAGERYFEKLKGVTEPEEKRKIIGEEFIRIFEEEAKRIGKVEFLAQGTIYPDVIESGLGKSAVIKSHHNVGGLPDYVDFDEIIEPLRMLFKDEVRTLGRELGLPDYLVDRQPFPGPGLGVRIIGEVTPDKVKIVQEADAIFREEIDAAGLSGQISQYFAALTGMRSVGVMGDFRTYDYAIALRAVETSDFMTAEAFEIPWDVLKRVMTRIVNEVEHVNRVLYDVSSKPPGTVEFE